MIQQKTALRRDMKTRRNACHAQDQGTAAPQIAAHILRLPELAGEVQRGIRAKCHEPRIVAGYYPIQTEMDGLFILKALSAIQCRCALPVVTGKDRPLIFRAWDLADALVKGPFDTREPDSDCEQVLPEIILIPLLAFDEKGHRLGYGGGYYDRTLADYRDRGHAFTAIGVAFEGQKRDHLPTTEYDQPLDIIVTEQKVYRP